MAFHKNVRTAFSNTELTQIVEAMLLRGIRVRCHPSGFEESHDFDDALPSDEELEDDELRFLREAQANKPY
jgi:hypothetical protein